MNLNLHVLQHDLSNFSPIDHLNSNPWKRAVRSVQYLMSPPEDPLDTSSVYLTTPEVLSELTPSQTENISFICIGELPQEWTSKNTDVISVSAESDPGMICACIANAFNYYNDQILAIQNALYRNMEWATVGKLALRLFDHPLEMIDSNFQYIFTVNDPNKYELPENYFQLKYEDEATFYPTSELDLSDGKLERALAKQTPIMSATPFGYQTLLCSVMAERKTLAILFLDEIGSPITTREICFLKVLSEIFSQSATEGISPFPNNKYTFEKLLWGLAYGKPIPHEELVLASEKIGWKLTDTYSVILARPVDVCPVKFIYTTATRIVSSTVGLAAIDYGDDIAFIVNTNIYKNPISQAVETILDAYGQRAMNVGISNTFQNIENILPHCHEALAALNVAANAKEKPAVEFYEKLMLHIMFDEIKKDNPRSSYCPYGLIKLLEYDAANDENLAYMLLVHLENNMSIVESAKQLYLHRNTLSYKLDKTRAIIGMDLDDVDTRLLLQISLHIVFSEE